MSTTMTSRDFDQDTGRAKEASRSGPVIITDRGRPAHVLLTIEEYRRIVGQGRSIADLLAMPDDEGLADFDAPRSRRLPRLPDLG